MLAEHNLVVGEDEIAQDRFDADLEQLRQKGLAWSSHLERSGAQRTYHFLFSTHPAARSLH